MALPGGAAVLVALCLVELVQEAATASTSEISAFSTPTTVTDKSITQNFATNIAFTGTTTSRKGCFASACTACDTPGEFTSLAGGTVSFTVADLGTLVLCVADSSADVTNSANVYEQTGAGTLTVVTATSSTLFSAIDPTSGLVAGAPAVQFSLTGSISDHVKVMVAETCASVDFKNEGQTLFQPATDPTFTQMMGPLSSGTTQTLKLCVQKTTGSDFQAQSGVSVTVNAASIAGDPVAYFGKDRRVAFWLPIGMFMPLLRTSDLDVWGRTQRGLIGEKGQFFDDFVVASRGGLTVNIGLRKTADLLSEHGTVRSPSTDVALRPTENVTDLDLLDVNFVEGHARATVGLDDGWVQVQGLKRQDVSALERSVLPQEAVEILSSSAHFTVGLGYTIDYSAAGETALLYDYSHLAMQMIGMPDSGNYTGVFPELWGLQAPSKCTSRLMVMEGGLEDEDLPTECFKFEVYDEQLGKLDEKAIPSPDFSVEL